MKPHTDEGGLGGVYSLKVGMVGFVLKERHPNTRKCRASSLVCFCQSSIIPKYSQGMVLKSIDRVVQGLQRVKLVILDLLLVKRVISFVHRVVPNYGRIAALLETLTRFHPAASFLYPGQFRPFCCTNKTIRGL